MKYLLVLTLCLIFNKLSYSQVIFKGSISDTLNNPIPFAQVLLQDESKSVSHTFSIANAKGEYSIHLKKSGKYILEARALGFKPSETCIIIPRVSTDTIVFVNFSLKRHSYEIEEVVLAASAPILVKQDTIIYNTQAFLKGGEVVAEDILKALPGINVDESGKVTFFNQEVEKIMVEGDDLFNKGYRIISRNLPASMVDKVEVYQRYSAKALLKGIEDSDKVALNLTLKKERRLKVFGRATLGANSIANYEVKTTLMSFQKKAKYYLFGNSNSMGYDASFDVRHFINPLMLDDRQKVTDLAQPSFILQLYESRPSIQRSRASFGSSQLVSLNTIISPSSKLKAKITSFFVLTKDLVKKEEYYSFLTSDLSFENSENYEFDKKVGSGFINADISYSSKDKEFEYSGAFNRFENSTSSKFAFNNNSTNQMLNSFSNTTNHYFTSTNRYNPRSAFQVIGHFLYDTRPELYHVNTFQFQSLFPELSQINASAQRVSTLQYSGGAVVRHLTRVNEKFNIDSRFHIQSGEVNLTSKLSFLANDGTSFEADSKYSNGLSLANSSIGLGTSMIYTLGKFAVTGGLTASKHLINHVENIIGNKNSYTPEYISPSLGLRVRVSQLLSGAIMYSYNTTASSLEEITSGYLLRDYRSMRSGMGSYSIISGNSFIASFNMGRLTNGNYEIFTTTMYNQSNASLTSQTSINQNYSLVNTILGGDRKMLMNTSSFSYFVRLINCNIKLIGGFMGMEYDNILNSIALRTKTTSYNYGFELRSGFIGFFNFHFGTHWNHNLIKPSLVNAKTSNRQFLDLLFNFSEKRISGQLRMERLFYGNINSPDNPWYFVDAKLLYRVKPNRLQITVSANNLLNYKTFGNYILTEYSERSSIYPLVPRFVMVSAEISF